MITYGAFGTYYIQHTLLSGLELTNHLRISYTQLDILNTFPGENNLTGYDGNIC